MDAGVIAKTIADQFMTVANAPVPFIAAILFTGWLILQAVKREYSTRLANAASTIEMLEKRLDRFTADEVLAINQAAHEYREAKQQVLVAPPGVPETPNVPQDSGTRVYTDRSVEYLLGLFEERTALQAQKGYKPEINKWMVAKGPVGSVRAIDQNEIQVALTLGNFQFVYCYFSSATPGLEDINAGDLLSVEGRIEAVDTHGVTLVDCAFRE